MVCKTVVEAFHENMLLTGKGNTVGLIFNLKNNFGWADKKDFSHSTGNDNERDSGEDWVKEIVIITPDKEGELDLKP